jgi:hypothetical protein
MEADMVYTTRCRGVGRMIVDLTYDQRTLDADGGLSIDLLQPDALVYELFAGFARTVSQRMTVNDLGSETAKFNLLEFLQHTSEIVGSSLDKMRAAGNDRVQLHQFNALVLVRCAVDEAKSVLDAVHGTVRVRSGEAMLECTPLRKRRGPSVEAQAGEEAGCVVAALSPLTRLFLWLIKHHHGLPAVEGEDAQSFTEDMQSLTMNLELGASHLSRMIDVNKMLMAGFHDRMKNTGSSPLVKNLKAEVQELSKSCQDRKNDFDTTWKLLHKSTLMITDSMGTITHWHEYGKLITSLDSADVLGRKISELLINGSEVDMLLESVKEQPVDPQQAQIEIRRLEVVLNTKPVCLNILLTLFFQTDGIGNYAIIWHGENVTRYIDSI